MTSNETSRAWQLAAVSLMGRVTVAALSALAVYSVVARSTFSSAWVVAALAIVPLVVAIRVTRGFDQALPASIATFVVGGAIASATGGVIPLLISTIGIVAAYGELRGSSRRPTIELTRTNRDGPEPAPASVTGRR